MLPVLTESVWAFAFGMGVMGYELYGYFPSEPGLSYKVCWSDYLFCLKAPVSASMAITLDYMENLSSSFLGMR